MDDVTSAIEKITKGIKSGEKAKDVISQFFEEHGDGENCKLIDELQNFIDENPVGNRSSKKFVAVQSEIIEYLLADLIDEADDRTIEKYTSNLQISINRFLEADVGIPLVFIPFFYTNTGLIMTLGDYDIWTLQQLLSCEQETLLEAFKENEDFLTSLVLFFATMGIELNVPKG